MAPDDEQRHSARRSRTVTLDLLDTADLRTPLRITSRVGHHREDLLDTTSNQDAPLDPHDLDNGQMIPLTPRTLVRERPAARA